MIRNRVSVLAIASYFMELVRAFRRFEAHVTPLSERFLDDVIGRRSSNRSRASQR
jgi:hypothetical protein